MLSGDTDLFQIPKLVDFAFGAAGDRGGLAIEVLFELGELV